MRQGNAVAQAEFDMDRPCIWAVGGGKGGVGKSFISSSMGLALAKAGKRVVLVDLDLGGANLHTSLGIRGTRYTLSDYLNGRVADINSVAGKTDFDNVKLISGASDSLNIANIKFFQKAKLLRNLAHLDADYVILDLGAGTSFNTLDFFIHADHGIVSVTPDPGSVENTYRFLKCVFIRQLRTAPEQTRDMMQEVLTHRRKTGRRVGSLAEFIEELAKNRPTVAEALRRDLDALNLHIIINQVMEPGDTELGRSMQMVCSRYFGTSIGYLGFLHHDRMVLKALQQRRPFLTTFPQSRLAIHMDSLVASLMAQDEVASR